MKFIKVLKAENYLYTYAKTNLRFTINKREDDGKVRYYVYDNKQSKPYYGNSKYEIVPPYYDTYEEAKDVCYELNQEEIKELELTKDNIKKEFDLEINKLKEEKETKLNQTEDLINKINTELNNL